jgi:hypothetical protein
MQSELTSFEKNAQHLRYGMWRAVPTDVAREAGISVCRFGPVLATVVCSLPEDLCLNRVQGAAEPGAISGGHLADAIDWMDSMGVEYSVPVTEGRPGSIKAVAFLGNRGFGSQSASTTYRRGILPPRQSANYGIKINPLGESEAGGFGICQIADDVFGLAPAAWALIFPLPTLDGWHCYTASMSSSPRAFGACGAMYINDGVARFGVDATIESARFTGLNQALLHRRIADAGLAGGQVAVAEVADGDQDGPEVMRHNLTRIGFEPSHRTQYWARPVSDLHEGGVDAACWLGL